ncbi:MAG: ATP-dependent Clp protease proteolytic subunit [Chloroflexales bacterium]
MKRIEVRGIIVGSEYDDVWFEDYISRGIIIPESRFRKMLAEIDPDEDEVEIYLNSPGGSVFAGNEMINTLVAWRAQQTDGRKAPRQVSITIGSLAASMGAVMAISCSDVRRMHANGKLMFHSAWGGTVGGPQAMQDTAALLEKINADIKGILVGRFKCNPDEVSTWFAEGREGWLSAQDAKDRGLIDEIIGSEAPAGAVVEFPEAAALAARGLKLAACTGVLDIKEDSTAGGQGTAPGQNHTLAPEGSTPSPTTTVPSTINPTPPAGASGESQPAGGAPDLDAAISDAASQIAALKAKVQEHLNAAARFLEERDAAIRARDEARSAQAGAHRVAEQLRKELAEQSKKAEAKLSEVTEQRDTQTRLCKQATDRLNRITTGALSPSPDSQGPVNWDEAMARASGATAEAKLIEARQRWPLLYLAYLENHGGRRNPAALGHTPQG